MEGGWHDVTMEKQVASLPSEHIPSDHRKKYNVTYTASLPYMDLVNDDTTSFLPMPPNAPAKMRSSCIACKNTIKNSIHICAMSDTMSQNVFACRLFERHFDLVLGEEVNVSSTNTLLNEHNENFFCYRVKPPSENATGASPTRTKGKDMGSLRLETIFSLFMESCWEKVNIHRLASYTLRASKVRMYLSRIDQPLKKFNNDKGNIKLRNHSNTIRNMGHPWVKKYVMEEMLIVDLMNHRGESYVEKSKDYMMFPYLNHKIIMKATLYKLENYI